MSAITFSTLDFTGSPDSADQLAARFIVRQENARRALLEPPGVVLPTGTANQLKNSYLTVLLQVISTAHVSYIGQASNDDSRLTDAQKEQIKANLNSRLDAGETAANLVIDTAA